jgi:hypothetical protein
VCVLAKILKIQNGDFKLQIPLYTYTTK